MGRLEGGAQHSEVEELDQARVEQPLVYATTHVGVEVTGVECLQLLGGVVVAEYPLVDRLEQESGGDGVESRVVLDVLESDLDDSLIELLSGDAIEQRELEFACDLGDPSDVVVESGTGALDREIDLVGVVRFALAVALHHGDGQRH